MAIDIPPINNLNQPNQETLDDLATTLELSDGTTIVFAIAPESAPNHPVVEQLKSVLNPDEFQVENFFYSQESLIAFLYALDKRIPVNPDAKDESKRPVIMAFGIEQLPRPRILKELKRLNLGREALFSREIVLIFWLNKREFLEAFRGYAPDFWDWREKVVKFTTRPPLNSLLYPYLESLIAENSYLKMSGVMQVQRQVDIFLDQVYVSLKAERQQQVTEFTGRSKLSFETQRYAEVGAESRRGMEFAPSEITTKTVTHKVDLAEAVGRSHYSVILGDPGAGKTTLLRYLALHFAMAQRDGKVEVLVENVETYHGTSQGTSGNAGNKDEFSQSSVTNPESLGNTRFPVFLRVADYAERLVKQPELSLLAFLEEFYQQWEADVRDVNDECRDVACYVSTLLCDKMRQGECLVLLDGLDEVFNQTSRQQIVKQIEAFVTDYPDNKYVITSRIAGYQDVKLGSRFTQFTITQMEFEQVERFLRRWCLAIEKAQKPEETEEVWRRDAEKEAEELLEAIQGNEGVKRLTGNPLLLTILALIHRNGSRLPNRRVELYALAVKTLIEDWQLSKNLPDAPQVMLRESEVIELLAPLAYWMHEEKPSGLITQAEAEAQLGEKLAELNDEDAEADSVKKAVQEFLRRVRETTGLFVERAPNVYGFMHLTFEEYFVARYIADNEVSEILEIIQKHQNDARWQEPILLALGYLGIHSPKRANKLINMFLADIINFTDPFNKWGKIIMNLSANIFWDERGNSRDNILLFLRMSLIPFIAIFLRDKYYLTFNYLILACRVLSENKLNKKNSENAIKNIVLIYVFCADNGYNYKHYKHKNRLPKTIAKIAEDIFNDNSIFMNIDQFTYFLKQKAIDRVRQKMLNYMQKIAVDTGIPTTIRNRVQVCLVNIAFNENGINLDDYELNNKSLFLEDDLGIIYSTLGENFYKENQYKEAIAHYQQSLEICEQLDKQKYVAIQWNWLSSCYRNRGQYEKAIECQQKCLTICQQLYDPSDIALAYYQLGRIYQDWGKYEDAIAHHHESLELYEQLDKQKNVSNKWYWLAVCYRNWGKYEKAIECQQNNLAIRQQLDDQSNIADAYFQFGRIYQDWGKYEEAIAHYQQSLELYEQLDKQQNVANQWYWLADCYRDWGQYEKAIECEQKDLAIRQQLNDQPRIASAYFQLGSIYQDWGKYEEAIAHHQQSLELYEQLDKQQDVADSWYLLAVCYRDWGQYEKAIECEQKDLAICQQLDDQTGIALAYYQLGRIYQEWGKYEEAITHHQQSLELYEQLDKQQDVANQWYWLGDCYRNWGQYEKAIECEQKCLAIRQQLDNQSDIALAYYQLGRIYQEWGKYKDAITHHQQSRDLYQQIGNNERTARSYRHIGKTQRLLAQTTSDTTAALTLLSQADENIRQSIQINTKNDYKKNQGYDYIALALVYAERFYQLPADDSNLSEQISQFQTNYTLGLTHFRQLGQTVDSAEETLDIARAYLRINPIKWTGCTEYRDKTSPIWEPLNQAETLTRAALETFQSYNRGKLQAAAQQLLEEIHQRRAYDNQPKGS